MEIVDSFNNQLLIAMPGMADPNFSSTVTLICEHNSDGALGIVINRPMGMNLGGLFAQLAVPDPDAAASRIPVLDGGPVARDRGVVLHNPHAEFESSVAVSPDIQLTLSRDILDAIAAGKGPKRSLVALGYAGWQPGQLEAEMLANAWLSVPATPELIFDVPFSKRWITAADILGVDISRMSSNAGHA
jgi:putative transcriptional regulator